MKKILLPAALLFASYATFAQEDACPESGFTTTGVSDDFDSETDPSNEEGTAGLYLWEDKAVGEVTETNDNEDFGFSTVRDAENSELDVLVTQPYGAYVPFGVSFGPIDEPTYLDLTGDKTFSTQVTNLGDSTIKFRIAIQDANDLNIDTYAAYSDDIGEEDPLENAYKYTIEVSVPKGESAVLSGTFEGGAYADYDETGDYVTGFDYSQVKAVLFTVANANQNEADGWKNYALEDYPISIDYFRVGSCENLLSTRAAAAAAVESSKLFPNPATTSATVQLNLKSASDVKVTVSDMMGRLVDVVFEGTATSVAEQINVSNLAEGTYTVNYFVDGTPAKSELLLVK